MPTLPRRSLCQEGVKDSEFVRAWASCQEVQLECVLRGCLKYVKSCERVSRVVKRMSRGCQKCVKSCEEDVKSCQEGVKSCQEGVKKCQEGHCVTVKSCQEGGMRVTVLGKDSYDSDS